MPDPEEPVDSADAARWARLLLAEDAASAALGMELVSAGPGRAVVSMRVRADMVNGHAIAHGGLVASLADTAFAVACNATGEATVASGFTVDFVEPAHLGDELVAEAVEVVRRGRSGVYDVTVRRGDVVVATFRGRCRALGRPIGG
jgi:acyl-CoA thioesterase